MNSVSKGEKHWEVCHRVFPNFNDKVMYGKVSSK